MLREAQQTSAVSLPGRLASELLVLSPVASRHLVSHARPPLRADGARLRHAADPDNAFAKVFDVFAKFLVNDGRFFFFEMIDLIATIDSIKNRRNRNYPPDFLAV